MDFPSSPTVETAPLPDDAPLKHRPEEWEAPPIGLQILLWFSLNLFILCLIGGALYLRHGNALGTGGTLPHFTSPVPNPCWISALLLTGSVFFWIPLFRRITIPIRRMQKAARALSQGNFHVRVPVERRDELGCLAASLNHLAAHLEGVLDSKQQFLADTAHELSSPLARMEWALSIVERKSAPELQPALQDLRDEVRLMSSLLQDLLQLSKTHSMPERILEAVCLESIVQSALRQEAPPHYPVATLRVEDVSVLADPRLLTRAVANVVRNAVRYASDGGPLQVETQRCRRGVVLRLTDDGPGVAAEDLPKLCEPFFRPESARSRQTGGVGLGLSIVKRCVEACGGTLAIFNASPRGLCVEITLEVAQPA
jgi:two-component system sensor histidine kinase CpxA